MKDSRKSIRMLARKLGIPASTLHDRVKKLVKRGIIRGFTVLLDEAKLGYTVKALILINVDGKHILEVEEQIAENPNVQLVLDITGEFDIAILAVFKSIGELDNFVKKLLKNPYIKQTRTSIAFRVVKQTHNIPL
ncbi:MAG: AsnC family transcriptional regulator [Desulfurococcales archaeon ex4484_58]|nr:MAG: AsnC family transcriptional regulator [Desulfurococcales archaeon ex4484_58]